MTGEIYNEFGPVVDGTENAIGALPVGKDAKLTGSGADPRLLAAVDEADAQNRKSRDKVRERGEKTSKYTKGLAELQERGARNVKSTGVPPMPTVPQSGQAAPPAPAPAPAPAAPAMSMPSVPAPVGIRMIDPALLEALVQASQDRASGGIPELAGDPASASSATSPQNPQPLALSQVSLAKYGSGPLSQEETAAVIDQALTINGVPNDPALRAQWHDLYQHMAVGESSRDPDALNNWDSNATGAMREDGAYANSSRGMWQTIPSTFAAYHMAGTSTSIYDPVASAAASMNYVMNTYNVAPTGQGLQAFMVRQGVGTGGYQGY